VLNLTDAIGNEHQQIIFQVGVDRKENYAGGYCLPVSYFWWTRGPQTRCE